MKPVYILLLAIVIPLTSYASKGQEGGGGSQTELDFVQIGRYAALGIANSLANNEGLFSGFNLKQFNAALGSVEIHEVAQLCVNEPDQSGVITRRCLDAFYKPQINQIQLNAATWSQKSCTEKMGIAAHEFGRASGNENGSYAYSSKVSFSRSLAEQCIPYYNQAGSQALSCAQKATYLDQSLQSLNSSAPADPSTSSDYLAQLQTLMTNWRSGIGKGCASEGESSCLKACFLKIGSTCFTACATN